MTKQKRLNLYRSLMKLEKFSNTQIVINSGNGMIFGGITVKLSKKVDFRYVAKQIALQQSMFIKNIFLVLNLTN